MSFLTDHFPESAIEAYEAGALELLMPHLDSEVAGMRAAAATSLHSIFMKSDAIKAEFVKLGGIGALVRQLDAVMAHKNPDVEHANELLEAVLNLHDAIENSDGAVVEKYALEAIDAGAPGKLEALLQETEDEDVLDHAEEVLSELDEVALQEESRRANGEPAAAAPST